MRPGHGATLAMETTPASEASSVVDRHDVRAARPGDSATSRTIRHRAPSAGAPRTGPMAWLGASSAKAGTPRPLAAVSRTASPDRAHGVRRGAALSTTCLSRSRRRR
jgi:hypothetical protein